MVQVTIIRLIGYREWTETLGPDREHVIQQVQAQLHRELVHVFSRLNAWAHPLRYDYLLAITNGLSNGELTSIIKELSEYSPVPLSSGTYADVNPRVAEREAFRLAMKASPGESLIGGGDDGYVAIAHIDLVDSTTSTEWTSSYQLYEHVWSVVNQVRLYLAPYGGITLYLGGDNIVSIVQPAINENDLKPLANLINARIGVGIARSGRVAMKLATEALDSLRTRNGYGVMMLRED
ncbi:GTP cyclohydrolase IIa [Vulcanisaeta distributa]|uniref:GTP cyclohydrolase III n=1 Tax=Vulcanisaeta distributa (strain DSM 14429 / JCM 11212 / NBRC 100878 / IC-017) TaxID=572478 RepID=E1QTN4_VULDI|nr:GTP cyclohydrolase IIa [Vulcanisaeta distributa]ADN49749.1 GTP cyclohydrolase IIa [Vulcanisaeta distributa DSM 14429]